jgi:predicted flap endonuclease-1-like 5' DNA nuclease
MQEFFMDYGLWLLVGLLVIIGLVFLLSGKRKSGIDAPTEPVAPSAPHPLVDTAPVTPAASVVEVPSAPAPVVAGPAAIPPSPAVVEPEPEPFATPAPVVAAEPVPVSPAVTAPAADIDDLLKLKGVGPKLRTLLIELGVTRYAQIAAWSDADIAAIDGKLGNFKGRPVRDQWIDQAKYLAAGDVAGFEAKYGKL